MELADAPEPDDQVSGPLSFDPRSSRLCLHLKAGDLPPGRFRMTPAQVESTWVTRSEWAGTTREGIWGEWQRAAKILRSIVPVYGAWLGGSFLSAKQNPGDLDCVWIIDELRIQAAGADRADARLLAAFGQNKLKRTSNPMRVDSFILPWRRWPGSHVRDEGDWAYTRQRGYWDDLWQRVRPAPPMSASEANAEPRRGYAEVVLDGSK